MRNLRIKMLSKYFLYALLCVCFFSCGWKEHKLKHDNKIDSIQVVTVLKDTVWIYAHSSGHIKIVPKDYRCEK